MGETAVATKWHNRIAQGFSQALTLGWRKKKIALKDFLSVFKVKK